MRAILSWEKYYEKNKGRPVRTLYSDAIKLLPPSSTKALDAGCGAGIEVLDLMARGFQVHAIDQEMKSIELIRLQVGNDPRLQTYISSLENWNEWPKVDFLFAYHSFPFCSVGSFDSVLQKATESVVPSGILAVSFFGLEDEWVVDQKVIGISSDNVRALLRDFSILHFEEIKKVGQTTFQGEKLWHVIEVIARRNS